MIRLEWINTSVSDLRGTLDCHRHNGSLPAIVTDMRDAAAEAHRRGHKTRERLLRSFIDQAGRKQPRLRKQRGGARCPN